MSSERKDKSYFHEKTKDSIEMRTMQVKAHEWKLISRQKDSEETPKERHEEVT